MGQRIAILESCEAQLTQLHEFISECPHLAYNTLCRVMGSPSTIGKHVQHALAHYVALWDVIDQPGLPIRYDDRRLRARLAPVGKEASKAIEQVAHIVKQLEELGKGDPS